MKLLVLTQKVDKDDPILGFFHRWIEEFSKNFEKVTVICLEKGQHALNAKILSLGKEAGGSKIKYIINFYKHIWQERNNYDAVFVHMNQEYVFLAGDLWRLMGKKIFLWRNHPKGNILTRLAVLLSHKVFYTSPSSFTARFRKSVIMPVGIDTNFFKPSPSTARIPGTVLILGRISPVKKVMECINWIKNQDLKGTIAGPILPEDKLYGNQVLDALNDKVKYIGPYTQEQELKLCQTHEMYINKTPAGSFDKTIFEAAACGMKLLVDNPDAQSIKVEEHSLEKLMAKLKEELS